MKNLTVTLVAMLILALSGSAYAGTSMGFGVQVAPQPLPIPPPAYAHPYPHSYPYPDIWLCLHKDGSLFYTDRPPYGLQCQLYAPPVVVIPYVIPYDPAPGHTLPYGSALPGPTPPAAMAPSAKAGPNDGAPGKIDFEKFRMLSEGMTESDVLALAGSPGSEYTANCSPSLIPVACPKYWIYTYGDNWTASVTLLDGRVIGIMNDRRP